MGEERREGRVGEERREGRVGEERREGREWAKKEGKRCASVTLQSTFSNKNGFLHRVQEVG